MPAYQAILADKLMSPLLDRYLARTAVDAQQDEHRLEHERQDNLFEPVAGDHGAHGRFDERSRSRSPLLWASEHRNWIAGGLAFMLGAAGLLAAKGVSPHA